MSVINTEIKPFNASAYKAGKFIEVSDADVKGKWSVFFFYPADFTPGCTRQACVLRDLHSEIASAGLSVVGISPQSPASHAKFKTKYQLPFVLLSDEQKTVIKMYGVNGPLGIGVRRATYLVDASRRVRDAYRTAAMKVHSQVAAKYLLQKVEINETIRSTPVVANGVLYVMTERNLYALNAK